VALQTYQPYVEITVDQKLQYLAGNLNSMHMKLVTFNHTHTYRETASIAVTIYNSL